MEIAVIEFLSDEAIELHKEWLNTEKLRMSILEKSIGGIKGKSIREIMNMKLKREDKEDVLLQLSKIKLHECFFNSFGNIKYPQSNAVKSIYGNSASFLNKLYSESLKRETGFLTVLTLNGALKVCTSVNMIEHFNDADPILAIDLSEHVYFLDYGFDKERFLFNALPYLSVDKLL